MTDALLEVLKDRVDWDLRPEEANDWATIVVPQAHTSRNQEPTRTMVAASRGHAAKRRLDGDFISKRLHGKQRFFHANVDRAGENAVDAHVIVVRDSSDMLATQLDVDTYEPQAAATTADLGIWSFVLHGVGGRGWISCTLPSEPRRETQGAANVEQGFAGALWVVFFCANHDRTLTSHVFRDQFCSPPIAIHGSEMLIDSLSQLGCLFGVFLTCATQIGCASRQF